MANALTILRLLLVPVFAYLSFQPAPVGTLVAAAVFGLAALTDLFDGMVARRTNTVSEFGKIADPLVDRALIVTVLVVLVLQQAVPLWAAAIVIGRDLVMVAGYRLLQSKGTKPAVSQLGKYSTAVLMAAVVTLILRWPFGVYAFYAGVFLSVISGLQYLRQGIGTALAPRKAEEDS